ncbi:MULTISPECIES: ABC transporter substrate-binding protein [Paenibacillus]|uniref:ABC transporter substrate-binding protein n=1 Tax=Paenibacillus TaxID=44249 RepID=UPI0003D32C73|nr:MULTISPECIES: ABC transporter substrate-binding protein [Paenibacillus]AIW40050.1 ABC transporter substrate-binding protein [Paenibacillus polymyxa CR1]OMF70303.1 ABC transporter substrate-binding protein [Paenibacillus peoriae]OMF81229.1 ABC transporter substrate-binding protein [Paenibacillus peoriae]POR28579.1 ABC transporter substrate-binding protein [Paenibacillus polymyxa]
MRKKLKLLSALLLGSMVLVSACSSSDSNSNREAESNNGEVTELTVAFPIFSALPKDMSLIEGAVNEIAQEKINVKVKLIPISFSNWMQQTNLMFSGGEQLDLMPSLYNYSQSVLQGQLIPLDDLLEKHGQGITEALDPAYLDASRVNGTIYGVPALHEMAVVNGISMREDIVDKYQIDTSKLEGLEDLEDILKTVKAGEPNMAPIIPSTVGASVLNNYKTYDDLNNSIGVLPNYDNNLKVVNLYETDEYAKQLKMLRRWYQEGLILQDASTNQANPNDLIDSKRGFSYLISAHPAALTEATISGGVEKKVTTFSQPPVSTTSQITNTMWGITVNSKSPDKAMEFLNLMYSDKDIANLLIWGIEGKHYEVKSGNIIDFPEGVDAQSSGYYLNMGWLLGNQFMAYIWNGTDPELWEKVKKFNESATKSKALGFTFDPSTVKTEVAAIGNVITQYALPLETGSVDPDNILPKFIASLKAAGVDKVIAEKQKQLDEWAQKQK